jgi:hypothetical protein
MTLFVLVFASITASAYSGDKLCYQEGRRSLGHYFANSWSGERVSSAQMDSYTAFVNAMSQDVVQYRYHAQTNKGYRYVRITLLKNGCQMLVADAASSKEDMAKHDKEDANDY